MDITREPGDLTVEQIVRIKAAEIAALALSGADGSHEYRRRYLLPLTQNVELYINEGMVR